MTWLFICACLSESKSFVAEFGMVKDRQKSASFIPSWLPNWTEKTTTTLVSIVNWFWFLTLHQFHKEFRNPPPVFGLPIVTCKAEDGITPLRGTVIQPEQGDEGEWKGWRRIEMRHQNAWVLGEPVLSASTAFRKDQAKDTYSCQLDCRGNKHTSRSQPETSASIVWSFLAVAGLLF